ncbi:MAG: SusC/RagA family TonB-linked outer membrane protein [Chitinophagaceae bacterium]|nr:MAG: SusC/RagA family TonB-linked outer membrane protein [Chitinophagaceae bacterium]
MQIMQLFCLCKFKLSRQIILAMKLTAILLLALFLQVSASSDAQKVTISGREIPVKKVFSIIKEQTGYLFFYDTEILKHVKPVSLNVKETSVESVLNLVFKDQPYKWALENRTVTVVYQPKMENEVQVLKHVVAPSIEVKGLVKDINGSPLSGVSVLVKGSTIGTQTDVNGAFTINVPSESSTLVFSSVGYEDKELVVKNNRFISVQLLLKEARLEETVIIAYGKAKVKDLTGSVSHIGQKDLDNAPMGSTVQSMLQGKAAGVNVLIHSASPTSAVSVVIRGASSLSGDNQPLWVIDGVPQYNSGTSGNITNTLYNLNLDDVESIDILKDASATAIYGSRGASGVVLVTTKHGREGMKTTIDFSARYGTQIIDGSKIDVLKADQYKELSKASVREAVMSVGGLDYFTRQFIDEQKFNEKFKNTSHMSKNWITDDLFKSEALLDGNTDWWNLMTQNAATQDYSLSLRGGSKQSNYYLSSFLKDQEGIVKGGIKMGVNVSANARNTSIKDDMLSVILKMRPDFPAYNSDGSINRISLYTKNPLLELEDRNDGFGKSASGTMYLEYDILKELKLRTTGTVTYSNTKNDVFRKSQYAGNLNTRSINQSENTVLVWENTLNYFKTIRKHDINALAGFSVEESKVVGLSASGSNFPDEEILINLGSAAVRNSIGSSLGENALVSAFARLNYKFNNKYLLTGTVRRDGSSRFGPDKRWGFFPSAALGWIISEENFIKENLYAISYLKLRASAGKTGSQNLGSYSWQTLMGSKMYNGLPGIIPATLGNDILQWESQDQIDLGLDYGILKDRIRGTFGWYQKKVNNLLFSDPVPTSSSFTTVTQNIGGIKNQGVEFDVKVDVVRDPLLTWTLDFNTAHNVSRLVKLNSKDPFYGGGAYQSYKVDVGGKLGGIYGYKYGGRLFQNQEEIIALKPILPTGYQTFYRDTYENPGDIYMVDLNGDGKITVDDRTYLGNANPDWYGGFGSTVVWNQFYFNATFSYAVGGKRLFDLEQRTSGDMNVYNVPTMAMESWSVKGKEGTLPRITYYGSGANNIVTDRFVHDASFLRLSALNIAYRIPEKILKQGLFKSIELSFQATNLFTLTKYPGFDPQGNFSLSGGALIGTGIDYSTYPQARNFNGGIKFTLR